MSCFRSMLPLFLLLVCFAMFTGLPAVQAQEIKPALEKDIQQLSKLTLDELIAKLDDTWKEYAKQLQAVVKARLLEEREFVAQVTLLVQQEQLPKKLVDSSWLWVRNNRPGSNSPFVYFERILRLQADKAGFQIPPFDDRIYSLSKARRLQLQRERQNLRRR